MTTIKASGAVSPGVPATTIEPARTGAAAGVAPTRARGADAAQGVLADLSAGRITPDVAVDRLTALAVAQSGATVAARPAVAERVRALLGSDPTLAALLGRMGAATPPET